MVAFDEAIAFYQEVERRLADATEPELRAQVATAMVNRGRTLGGLGRSAEEIAAYEDVERRFADATEPELRARVAMARMAHEELNDPKEC